LDRLAALAELLEAFFPELEFGLAGTSRHRVDSPAICIAKVQQRKKPTTQIRDMTPKSKTQLCTLTQGLCGKPLSRCTDGCSGGWGYAAGGEPKQIAIGLAGEQTKTDNHPEQVQVTDPPLCPARDLLIEQGLNLLGTEKVKHPAEPIGCEGILSCVVHVAFPLRNWV
jgi:hypothetical protein